MRRRLSLGFLALVALACTAAAPTATPLPAGSAALSVAASIRAASEPPVVSPDAQLRFTVNEDNELVVQEASTGVVRWRLPHVLLPGRSAMRWRVLVSSDGASVYVQSLTNSGSPSYLGTRLLDLRTAAELASDIKREEYWYDNVVLWTAITADGELQMAIARAPAAGGGYRLRSLDPRTLAIRRDLVVAAPPPLP